MMRLAKLALLVAVGAGAALPAAAAELNVGDKAPDFTLAGSDGKTYHLADFKGKKAVVLAWFPKAFTGGCTVECKSLAANGDKIRQYDVAYFMASVDAVDGEKGNKAFAESEKADFPLLSDPTKETANAYGVVHPGARVRDALDLLHRQGRQGRRHRQGGEAPDLGRGHDRQARGAEGRKGPLIPSMCHQVQCSRCGRPTWAGCGRHVEEALKGVPPAERCQCPPRKNPLARFFGR